MPWLIRETIEALGKTDNYYCHRRWLFYESVLAFLKEIGVDAITGKLLEVGVRSVALHHQSTVVESVIRPELLERHQGEVILAHMDRPNETHVLGADSFRYAICCQCFEHMDHPERAWREIKRVTTHGALITIPWRWPNNTVHNRDMRDLAAWTDGDVPAKLRTVRGPRLMAWYEF